MTSDDTDEEEEVQEHVLDADPVEAMENVVRFDGFDWEFSLEILQFLSVATWSRSSLLVFDK